MADSQLHADLKALSQAIKSLRDEVAELRKDREDSGKSVSSIRIDTGGASAWFSSRVASYCCAFMIGLSLGLVAMFVVAANERAELRSADSDFRDYISAIYQIAPELQNRMLEESKKDDQKTRE